MALSLEFLYYKTEEIFSLINKLGIEINKQSRFNKFRKLLELEIGKENENPIVFHDDGTISKELNLIKMFNRPSILGQGLRDFFELWSICSSRVIINENINELKQIFGGDVDQFKDSLSNTKSRDLQYQLFLTSIFELSGYDVVSCEPDFKFIFSNEKYSVACKRINSPNKIHKRIKEAEKQIIQSGTPGFIALSLDRLVGLNFFSSTTDSTRLRETAREMFYGILDSHYPERLPELDQSIIGIIGNLCMIGTDVLTDNLNFGYACEVLIFDQGDDKVNKKFFDLAYGLKIREDLLI